MKKIFVFAALAFVAVQSKAQDAVNLDTYIGAQLATEDLNGTARYVGMGGAMDALGADISTIGSNPAGIGLFRHSQVAGSFGLVSQSEGKSFADGSKTTPSFDQLGFVVSTRSGVHSFINFGFNFHKSRNFNHVLSAAARSVNGSSQNRQTYIKGVNGDLEQRYGVSMVDELCLKMMESGTDPETGNPMYNYINSDGYMFNRAQTGYIGEYDFNLSGNINNRVYLGLTVGIKGVHYNSYIESLKGIEYFTELETLECYWLDQLTSLDLSANTKMKELDCNTDGLTSLIVSNAATDFTRITCYNNQIKGAQMTALVESLPTVENGELQVINLHYVGEEGNEIDTNQVAIANAKGWKVLASSSTGWEEYAGSETTAITSVTSGEPQKTDDYYTTDGRLIKRKPTQRGLYINNGKKVIIK